MMEPEEAFAELHEAVKALYRVKLNNIGRYEDRAKYHVNIGREDYLHSLLDEVEGFLAWGSSL